MDGGSNRSCSTDSILSGWNLDDAADSSPWGSVDSVAGPYLGSVVKKRSKNPFRRYGGELRLRHHPGGYGSEPEGSSVVDSASCYASSEASTERGSKIEKPKPPKGAWMLYSYDARIDVMEKHPEASSKEISTIISKQYRSLAPDERGPWTEKARADKERYESEMAAYSVRVSEERMAASKYKDLSMREVMKQNCSNKGAWYAVGAGKSPEEERAIARRETELRSREIEAKEEGVERDKVEEKKKKAAEKGRADKAANDMTLGQLNTLAKKKAAEERKKAVEERRKLSSNVSSTGGSEMKRVTDPGALALNVQSNKDMTLGAMMKATKSKKRLL